MQTSQLIEELASGNASVVKDILNDMLSTKAFESLDAKKIELARNMFNGSEIQEEEVDLDEEDLDEASKLNKLINRYTDAKDDAKSGYDTMSDRADVKSKSKGTAKTNRTLKRDIKYAINRMGKPSNLPEEEEMDLDEEQE
jgi:hypothetical protein